MIKHFCDKCNTEIKRKDRRYEVRLTDLDVPLDDIQKELCHDCALKIVDYLKSSQGAL